MLAVLRLKQPAIVVLLLFHRRRGYLWALLFPGRLRQPDRKLRGFERSHRDLPIRLLFGRELYAEAPLAGFPSRTAVVKCDFGSQGFSLRHRKQLSFPHGQLRAHN